MWRVLCDGPWLQPRFGNRIVTGLITANLLNAIRELASIQPDRWQKWLKALFAAGIGGVSVLGALPTLTSRHRR